MLLKCSLLLATVGVFAQAADPISGGAGWVGTGLLGAVLSWLLLVHLPAKDKQLEAMVKSKDIALADKDMNVKEIIATFREETHFQQQQFKESLGAIVGHCEREVTTMQAEVGEVKTYLRTRIHDLLNVIGVQSVKIDVLLKLFKVEPPPMPQIVPLGPDRGVT